MLRSLMSLTIILLTAVIFASFFQVKSSVDQFPEDRLGIHKGLGHNLRPIFYS